MLTHAAPLAGTRRHRSALNLGIAVIALFGVPAIWLPFAYHTSPASALFEDDFFRLWPLAWPHLLAIPIAVALFRWVASGHLSNGERWSGRLFAAAAGCVTGWPFIWAILHGDWPSGVGEAFMGLMPLVILICGAALAVRALRSGRAPEGLDAVVMMEVAYLANVSLCLLAAGDWGRNLQIGAYAVLLTSVVYVIQIVAVQVTRPVRGAAPAQAPALL